MLPILIKILFCCTNNKQVFTLDIRKWMISRLDEIAYFKKKIVKHIAVAFDMIYDSDEKKQLFSSLEASLLSCINLG